MATSQTPNDNLSNQSFIYDASNIMEYRDIYNQLVAQQNRNVDNIATLEDLTKKRTPKDSEGRDIEVKNMVFISCDRQGNIRFSLLYSTLLISDPSRDKFLFKHGEYIKYSKVEDNEWYPTTFLIIDKIHFDPSMSIAEKKKSFLSALSQLGVMKEISDSHNILLSIRNNPNNLDCVEKILPHERIDPSSKDIFLQLGFTSSFINTELEKCQQNTKTENVLSLAPDKNVDSAKVDSNEVEYSGVSDTQEYHGGHRESVSSRTALLEYTGTQGYRAIGQAQEGDTVGRKQGTNTQEKQAKGCSIM